MSPFNSAGKIRQEDIRLESIERGRLTAALAQEAILMAAIVTSVITKINELKFRQASVESIWQALLAHPNLNQAKCQIDRLTGAYPKFTAQVIAARRNIEREQLARLREAKRPQVFQQKFAHTQMNHGAYATL